MALRIIMVGIINKCMRYGVYIVATQLLPIVYESTISSCDTESRSYNKAVRLLDFRYRGENVDVGMSVAMGPDPDMDVDGSMDFLTLTEPPLGILLCVGCLDVQVLSTDFSPP